MFIRIGSLVGCVLLLVYIADDYVPVSAVTQTAAVETGDQLAGPTEASAEQKPLNVANVADKGRLDTRPTVLPMNIALAPLPSRDLLPPTAVVEPDGQQNFVVQLRQTAKEDLDRRLQVTTAALRVDSDASVTNSSFAPSKPIEAAATTPRRTPRANDGVLAASLMVIDRENTPVHSEPKLNAGLKAVLNKGFIVTAFSVKGTNWMFIQDPKLTFSGYVLNTQLERLLLTQ